jgi:hypothetical protein
MCDSLYFRNQGVVTAWFLKYRHRLNAQSRQQRGYSLCVHVYLYYRYISIWQAVSSPPPPSLHISHPRFKTDTFLEVAVITATWQACILHTVHMYMTDRPTYRERIIAPPNKHLLSPQRINRLGLSGPSSKLHTYLHTYRYIYSCVTGFTLFFGRDRYTWPILNTFAKDCTISAVFHVLFQLAGI